MPASLAQSVLTHIVQTGKVVRGYLGIIPQDITPTIARALHLSDAKGVIIGDVEANTPAAQAGLQRGDILTRVNGQSVNDANQLRLQTSMLSPGTLVHLGITRNGNPQTIDVTLGEMPSNPQQQRSGNQPPGGGHGTALEGVTVDQLTPDVRQQLNLPGSVQGVVITDVQQGSAAAEAGLQPADVIQEVNRKPVSNLNDFTNAIRNAGKPVLLLVNRMGNTLYIAIE